MAHVHLPPAIERPVIKFHISAPKPKVPVPTFHGSNERSPKFKENRAKKADLKEQYLNALARTRRLEAAERRANIQITATRRLLSAFEEKRRIEAERKEGKSYVDQVRKEYLTVRLVSRGSVQQQREMSRRKMEDLYVAKHYEVEATKEEIKKVRDDHHKAKEELLALNRQLIHKERTRAKESKIRIAEKLSDCVEKQREQARLTKDVDEAHIKKVKEDENKFRTKMAESIKATLKANEFNRLEKNIDKKQQIAFDEVVSKKLMSDENTMSFYATAIRDLYTQEQDSRRRLDYQTETLKALQEEISSSFTAPVTRYHKKKFYPINA